MMAYNIGGIYLFLIISSIAVSTGSATGSCYARAIVSSANGSRFVGGYRVVTEPASDPDVQRILGLAISQINSLAPTNGPRYELATTADGQVKQLHVLRQLVNGFKFCIRFQSKVLDSDADDSNNTTPSTKTCDALAFKSFGRSPGESVPTLSDVVCS